MFPIIIQARLGSNRLPGKVLKPLYQWSVVEIMFQRLNKVFPAHQIIFAIPDDKNNDPLADKLSEIGAHYYRGSETNVYQRFYQVLSNIKCDFFIRLTADCPFICTILLQEGIAIMQRDSVDIVHTSPMVAEGLDFEIINSSAFKKLNQLPLTLLQQEHPTLYLYQHSDIYNIIDFDEPGNDNSSYRITLDEPEDLLLLDNIANHFQSRITDCSWLEIKHFLDNRPELLNLNKNIIRNEGLKFDK
jgi:spore coat polysaccharide biosynthesis protein SpsF